MSWDSIKKHRIDIFIVSLLIIGVGVIFLFIPSKLAEDLPITPETGSTVQIGDTEFVVEVVDTPEARAQGLSGRESLPENHGMLFVFDQADRYTFHMRNMQFPLDFIWINGDTVVDITENVPVLDANGEATTIQPIVPVDKVLEVSAGVVSESEIKLDHQVIIDFF